MSKPRVPEISIHVVGGTGSGRTTFIRRVVFDIFNNTYDPTENTGPYRKLVDVEDITALINIETSSEALYRHESMVDSYIRPADALILLMTPARPKAMEETKNLRFETLNAAIESKGGGGLIERVVIMKDIKVPWDVEVPLYGEPEIQHEPMDDEERKKREEEWEIGAFWGYDLAKRLGAKVTIACPRTGEGVNEVIDELVLEVLEKRGAVAKEARRIEEEERQKEEQRLKTAQFPFSRIKGLFKPERGE